MEEQQEREYLELKLKFMEQAKSKRKAVLITFVAVLAIVFVTIAILFMFINSYKKQIQELDAMVERYKSEAAVFEEASKSVTFAVLEASIKSVGKLVSAEYWYTDVAQFEDVKQIFGVDVALTKKSFLVKWSGVISAGVDLSKCTVNVDEASKVITVCLPEATIIAHDPDNESFETLDEKSGLFNPITVDDVRKFDLDSEQAMIERATASSLLDKAEENAKIFIQQMLLADPKIQDTYTIEVKFIED